MSGKSFSVVWNDEGAKTGAFLDARDFHPGLVCVWRPIIGGDADGTIDIDRLLERAVGSVDNLDGAGDGQRRQWLVRNLPNCMLERGPVIPKALPFPHQAFQPSTPPASAEQVGQGALVTNLIEVLSQWVVRTVEDTA